MDVDERIRELARDGVPASWIAETVGMTGGYVRKVRVAAGLPGDEYWMGVQAGIRRDDALRGLHDEIRPKRRG